MTPPRARRARGNGLRDSPSLRGNAEWPDKEPAVGKTCFPKAKKLIGNGGITLGIGVFKMSLHKTSASAAFSAAMVGNRSTFASIGSEISARGGYVAAGRNVAPATGQWTVGVSAKQYKFTFTAAGIVFTASGSSLINIRFAMLRNSTGAGAGKILAFASLSSAQFTITSPNTLTILPAATGVFTLA